MITKCSKLNYHQPLKEPQDITLHLNLEYLFLKDKLCQVKLIFGRVALVMEIF